MGRNSVLGKVRCVVEDFLIIEPPANFPENSLDKFRELLNKPVRIDGKVIGNVFDVIGDTKNPFIVVKSKKGVEQKVVGKPATL